MRRGERGRSNQNTERAQACRAFTLFEILLVIALMGMFTAIFVVNFEALVRQNEASAVETAFWEATRAARTRALIERRPHLMRFDDEEVSFVVEEPGGANRVTYVVERENWAPGTRLDVKLQKHVPPSQFSLIAGDLVDTRNIPAAHFFPDGTCSPFLVNLKVGADDFTIEIDPWTGAELLLDESE